MFAFVRRPPARIDELAAALELPLGQLTADGLYGMGDVMALDVRSSHVRALIASYAWDMHHEAPVASPDDLARRTLTRYTIDFHHGRTACESALATVYGPAAEVAGRRRYGPFFVDAGDGEAFRLEWHAVEPDWARPPVDAATRRDALAHLVARLTGAAVPDDVDAALAGIAPGSGIAAEAGGEPRLLLEPAVGALELAEVLGCPYALAVTRDVHQSHWTLARLADGRAAPPRVGAWQVEAALDAPPRGEPAPDVEIPAGAARLLHPDDAVRHVRFRRA